jgi:hypothetical protein
MTTIGWVNDVITGDSVRLQLVVDEGGGVGDREEEV